MEWWWSSAWLPGHGPAVTHSSDSACEAANGKLAIVPTAAAAAAATTVGVNKFKNFKQI